MKRVSVEEWSKDKRKEEIKLDACQNFQIGYDLLELKTLKKQAAPFLDSLHANARRAQSSRRADRDSLTQVQYG